MKGKAFIGTTQASLKGNKPSVHDLACQYRVLVGQRAQGTAALNSMQATQYRLKAGAKAVENAEAGTQVPGAATG